MRPLPFRALVEAGGRAITAQRYDELMGLYADDALLVVRPGLEAVGKEAIRRGFVAIAARFQHQLVVEKQEMAVVEGADTALVLMKVLLRVPGETGPRRVRLRTTHVFREFEGRWLCAIDNPYGSSILESTPATKGEAGKLVKHA